MKLKTILSGLTLTVGLASQASSAVMVTSKITDFKTSTLNTFDDQTVTNGVITGGTGTGQSQAYTLTNVNLTSIGGTATETITFTVSFTATNGAGSTNVAYKSWGDLTVGASLDTTNTVTATLSSVTSTFGTVSSSGFTNAFIEAFGSPEKANVTHAGGTIAAVAPTANHAFASSTSFTLAPTEGTMYFGGYNVQVTVVPEPSSTALLGLGGLALILRRRK